MKKRILAFILSGCILLQNSELVVCAAPAVNVQTEAASEPGDAAPGGNGTPVSANVVSEDGEKSESENSALEDGGAFGVENAGSDDAGKEDAGTDNAGSENAETDNEGEVNAGTEDDGAGNGQDSESGSGDLGEQDETDTDGEDSEENQGTDLEEQEADETELPPEEEIEEEEISATEGPENGLEEAIGEAAYLEWEADGADVLNGADAQKTQYAQSFAETQAVKGGTESTAKGLYFGYVVENDSQKTGMLSKYLSEAEDIVIPHKLGNYYMVGIKGEAFANMNKTDNSNISKLPTQSTSGKTLMSSEEEKILESVNAARIKQGKMPLVMHSTLREAARRKTLDMMNKNYFDHQNKDGSYTYKWLSDCGYRYTMWAENIAFNYQSASYLYDQWWNSSGHRQNMMNSDFRAIGIGVYKGSDGKIVGTQIFSNSVFQNLTKVKIEYGYESIGSRAFVGCTNLKSITIPSTVTKIEKDAFKDCKKLNIYGKVGSYAQTYAEENNIPFEAIKETCPIKKFRYDQEEVFIEKGDMDSVKVVMEPVDYMHLVREERPTDQKVVQFLKDGAMIAMEDGSVSIHAYAADLKAECRITVGERNIAIQDIRFDEEEIELYQGDSIKPSYRITPVDTTETVQMVSSDSSVIIVKEDGTVEAVGAGEARLTVSVLAASGQNPPVSADLKVKVLTIKGDLPLPQDLTALTNAEGKLADVSLDGYPGFAWKEPQTKLKAKKDEPVQYFPAQYSDGGLIKQDCIIPVAVSTVSDLIVVMEEKTLASSTKLSLSESYELQPSFKVVGAEVDAVYYEVEAKTDRSDILQVDNLENGGFGLRPKTAGKCNVTVEARLKDKNGSYGPIGKPYGTYKKKYAIQVEDAVYANKVTIGLEAGRSDGVQQLEDGSFLVEEGVSKFHIRAAAFDEIGREIQDAPLIFGTDKTGILQVRAVKGEAGLAEVTVKKKSGTATVTVKAKDNGKRSGSVQVCVQNLTPQLKGKTWTLNKYKPAVAAAFDLQEAEMNPIQSAVIYEDKAMEMPSALFCIQKDQDNTYALGFQNAEQAVKSSYKLYLKVVTQAKGREYIYPITVKLKNKQPSITMKQSAQMNLFYKDEAAKLTINTGAEKAVRIEQINIEKNEPHFQAALEQEDGVWKGTIYPVNVTAKNYKNVKKTIELRFIFQDYGEDFYITKTLKVKSSYKKAALTTTPSEGIIYQKTDNDWAVFRLMDKTKKENIIPGEEKNVAIVLDESMKTKVKLETESGRQDIRIKLLENKGLKVKTVVSHDNWQEPVVYSFKLVVNKKTPSLALDKTKISLNTKAAGKEIYSLKASASKNEAVTLVRLKEADIVGTNDAAKKLLKDGKISICPQKKDGQRFLTICLNDSSVKNGTYKYKVYGWCKEGETGILRMNPVTLSIAVSNKQPVVSLKAKGKINLSDLENSGIVYTPKISNVTGEIRSATLSGSYASAFLLTPCGDGTYQMKQKSTAKLNKGSYKLYFVATLENGVRVTSKALTVKIG